MLRSLNVESIFVLAFLILFFTRNQVPQIIIRMGQLIYMSLKAVMSLCDQKFKNPKVFLSREKPISH